MDRKKCREIEAVATAALAKALEPLGLSVRYVSGSFGATNFMPKFEVAEVGKDGQVQTRAAQDFTKMAVLFGLKPEWLNRTYVSQGRAFTITGLNPKGRRFPVEARRDDGKMFKVPAEVIRLKMAGALRDAIGS